MLDAAIRLADEGGIEALSMRRLAEELGVEAMSLYHYVSGKADLTSGMLDLVVREFDLATGSGDWKTDIRRSAISAHDVLMRHVWATELLMAVNVVSSARLRFMEALLRRLREAGFTVEMTHYAYHALDSHIVGSTLWEAGYTSLKISEERARDFLARLPADEFRYLLEHAEQHFAKPRPGSVREFDFGLDLILDGLERLRERATPRPVRRVRRPR